jgi:hypothetical protein
MLAGSGIAPPFTLFGAETAQVARKTIAGGLRATLARVDTAKLDAPLPRFRRRAARRARVCGPLEGPAH